jgi:hypothetical protein
MLQFGNNGLQFLTEHQIRVLLPAVLLYWAAHTQEVAGFDHQADLRAAVQCAGSLGVLAGMTLEPEWPHLPLADPRVVQAAMQACARDLLPLSAAVGSRALAAAAAAAASSSSAPALTGPQRAQQLPQNILEELQRQLHADGQPAATRTCSYPKLRSLCTSSA